MFFFCEKYTHCQPNLKGIKVNYLRNEFNMWYYTIRMNLPSLVSSAFQAQRQRDPIFELTGE